MDGLKEKTTKGLFWGWINSFLMQVMNLVFGIFLARLLSPSDYGLVGMLSVFIAIAGNLQNSGFAAALINIKSPKHEDYNSVFWFNVMVSLTLYTVLFFSAGGIARFFHQPELTALSRFVFFGFFLGSLGIVPNAYLTRHLLIRQSTIISTVALVLSGVVGITLAFLKQGYWSIAWQQVVFIGVVNIGRLCYVPWHPTLSFTFEPIRRMFPFSVRILVTMIVETLNQNLLTVIFGRLFSAKAVGNFTQAFKWNTMAFSLVSGAVTQVAQPVFASVRETREREVRIFRKMLRFTAFLSFPVMFGLMAVANEFIVLTISSKWLDSVPLLQLLCLSGAFYPFFAVYQNLMIGSGRSDVYMWCNVLQVVLQTLVILVFSSFGLKTMVLAYSVFNILWLLPWAVMAKRVAGVPLWACFLDVLPILLIAASVMLFAWYVTSGIKSLVLLLPLRVVIAAALYFCLMRLVKSDILEECLAFLKKSIHKR